MFGMLRSVTADYDDGAPRIRRLVAFPGQVTDSCPCGMILAAGGFARHAGPLDATQPDFPPVQKTGPVATESCASANNTFEKDGVLHTALRFVVFIEHQFEPLEDPILLNAMLPHFWCENQSVRTVRW